MSGPVSIKEEPREPNFTSHMFQTPNNEVDQIYIKEENEIKEEPLLIHENNEIHF